MILGSSPTVNTVLSTYPPGFWFVFLGVALLFYGILILPHLVLLFLVFRVLHLNRFAPAGSLPTAAVILTLVWVFADQLFDVLPLPHVLPVILTSTPETVLDRVVPLMRPFTLVINLGVSSERLVWIKNGTYVIVFVIALYSVGRFLWNLPAKHLVRFLLLNIFLVWGYKLLSLGGLFAQ
ncbi:MAG: hypothetical protein UY16_C0020G0013 [Candidatus Gottesmanbacteria bacterium GW2011_GWA2_47_9]|uniref:Uncharacterized protein n=1 Tax=Candidatus Gottesmanbacteria bacterium GW2011_GWA2_47_9 TaxID=1618445 RepID=A0A0G1U0T8_9BACT|nr:MAG: hypothetical protein UY16_C0020G0013 [Candidatus Gottesmanbacteria bacterium GW2011_GWA2_47_9]